MLCVEHQNTQDRNIFQSERVEIASPACALTSTQSNLSVFVSRLCSAKEPPLKKIFFSEKLSNVLRL
jgi:hypothetical protein